MGLLRKLELLFVKRHHEPFFFWDKSLLKLSTHRSPRGSEARSRGQQHPGPRCTDPRPAELPSEPPLWERTVRVGHSVTRQAPSPR